MDRIQKQEDKNLEEPHRCRVDIDDLHELAHSLVVFEMSDHLEHPQEADKPVQPWQTCKSQELLLAHAIRLELKHYLKRKASQQV